MIHYFFFVLTMGAAHLKEQEEETYHLGIQIHIGLTMPRGLRLVILLSDYTNKTNMKEGYPLRL